MCIRDRYTFVVLELSINRLTIILLGSTHRFLPPCIFGSSYQICFLKSSSKVKEDIHILPCVLGFVILGAGLFAETQLGAPFAVVTAALSIFTLVIQTLNL